MSNSHTKCLKLETSDTVTKESNFILCQITKDAARSNVREASYPVGLQVLEVPYPRISKGFQPMFLIQFLISYIYVFRKIKVGSDTQKAPWLRH